MDWDEWEPTTSVAQVKSVANGSSETAKVKSDEEENGTDEPVDAESSGLRSRDTKSRKRRKRKHLLTESLEKKKPVFDPSKLPAFRYSINSSFYSLCLGFDFQMKRRSKSIWMNITSSTVKMLWLTCQ